MGPGRVGEWDAMLDAPRMYRPVSVPGNAWKRWDHPAIPADVPGAPRGYFVDAIKA